MRRLFRRALVSIIAIGSVVALGATPVPAGVGSRMANGDGDTAGTCLSIENTGRGTRVLMESCTVNAHQGWDLEYLWGSVYRVRSQDRDADNRCLTAHGEGQQVTMEPCDYADARLWHRLPSGNWFQLEAYGTNQCLDVRANGLSNVVQTWLCGPNNKSNQLWKRY